MTTSPHSIGSEQNLETASEQMDRYKIRHLPVLKAGKVIGILSDRDIKLASSFEGFDPSETLVDDIAHEEVYVVSPNAKLDEVVSAMASKKLGSAVVMDNGKLVGIFTAVDALTAFAELLHTRLA